LGSISNDECVGLAIRLLEQQLPDEELLNAVTGVDKDPDNTGGLRRCIAALLYRVGVVGLKLEKFESVAWSTSGRRSISIAEMGPDVKISVHPCFWRSLGINPEIRGHIEEVRLPPSCITGEINPSPSKFSEG
jgi:hypothetical protein